MKLAKPAPEATAAAVSEPAPATIDAGAWVAFEMNYHALVALTSPVTAETLENTRDRGPGFRQASPARRFTWWLWGTAITFAVVVVIAEYILRNFGPALEGYAGVENRFVQIADVLVPYAYGGLGACAYLLRSAHAYIYQRCFDLRRRSEYTSRILLGSISGGAIVLLVTQIAGDDGTSIDLSAAAFGFIAGYSTDFLFNAVERVVAALLPKIDVDTLRRAQPRASVDVLAGGLTLTDLTDRFEAATTDEDRAMYRSLIEKVQQRM